MDWFSTLQIHHIFCCQNAEDVLQVDYAVGVVHENIVQLLDVFVEGERYIIVVRQTIQLEHNAVNVSMPHHVPDTVLVLYSCMLLLLCSCLDSALVCLAQTAKHVPLHFCQDEKVSHAVGAGKRTRSAGLAQCGT